jgi:hypothetical protein
VSTEDTTHVNAELLKTLLRIARTGRKALVSDGKDAEHDALHGVVELAEAAYARAVPNGALSDQPPDPLADAAALLDLRAGLENSLGRGRNDQIRQHIADIDSELSKLSRTPSIQTKVG